MSDLIFYRCEVIQKREGHKIYETTLHSENLIANVSYRELHVSTRLHI